MDQAGHKADEFRIRAQKVCDAPREGQLCKNTLLSDIVWKACLSIGSFDIWGKLKI